MKHPRALDAALSLAAVVLIALAVLLLAGCGGGGDDLSDKPDQTMGRPDCSASGVCT